MKLEITLQEKISSLNALCIMVARTISDFGAYLNMIALSTYVYFITNSTIYVGIFLACRVAGGIIASIIGTKFFRRFSGKWSLNGFDISRAVLLSLLLFTSIKIQIYILPIVALGIGLSGSMFSIGINSQLPHLIVEKKLVAVNSWISSLSATATIFGALTAGLIIAMSGYKTIFVINIITYLLAALAILPLKSIISQNNTIMKSISTRDEYNLLKTHLKQNKVIASILLVSMADTLGSAAHNVAFPVFSKLITPQTASQTMGLIIAFWAVGDFIGSLLSGRLLKNRSLFRMERLFTFGVGLMSTGFILLFFQEQMSLILACAVFAGIGDGILQVSLSSRIQYEPEAVRLSIFSLLTFFQMTGFAFGMIIAAPFFNWWLPSYVVLLFHGLALVLLFISWFMNRSIKPATFNE